MPAAIWRGDLEDAFGRPKAVEEETGVSWANWLFPALALAASFALLMLAAMWGQIRSITAAFSGFAGEFGFSTSELLEAAGWGPGIFARLFFGSLITMALMATLWYTAAFLATRYGGNQVSFDQAANGMSVGVSFQWFPLLLSSIPFLIFPFMGAWMIFGVVNSGIGLVLIILSYESVRRNGPFTKTPLIVYASLMSVATAVSVTVLALLLAPVTQLKESFIW